MRSPIIGLDAELSGASLLRQDHPVIGRLSPYMPGSWFQQFMTPTMAGLALVRGRRIDFLAIAAHEPGRGDCGRFLTELATHYDTIGVWELLNTELADMLARRGFTAATDVFDGEPTDGLLWEKPSIAPVAPVAPSALNPALGSR